MSEQVPVTDVEDLAPVRKWRVVLVDDHAIFRAGVRHELTTHAVDRVTVVGEGENVASAVQVVGETLPDVVLLDVHLPGGGGSEVVKQVHEHHPEVTFLALSVSDAAEDVIGVIRAGARGYVTKSIGTAELVEAIGRVATGDAVFSPRLAGFVLDAFSGSIDVASIDEDLDRLSQREREVLSLIVKGRSNKEIAADLGITEATVKCHVGVILSRLNVTDRTQAAVVELQRGMAHL